MPEQDPHINASEEQKKGLFEQIASDGDDKELNLYALPQEERVLTEENLLESISRISSQVRNVLASGTTVLVRQYTASGTWTKPANLRSLTIEVQAPGGDGGSIDSADTAASGGGSGGYAKSHVSASDLSSSEDVTIGATTSFTVGSETISCTAGGNGAQGDQDGGAGGTATGGDINIDGAYGDTSKGGSGSEKCGAGADSTFGRGGGAKASSGAGRNATGYGAGGGGAINTGGATTLDGGTGSPGIVVLTEYY